MKYQGKWFYVWGYNNIRSHVKCTSIRNIKNHWIMICLFHLPFYFLLTSPPTYPCIVVFKSMVFFFIIITCIYLYTCIFLNITCSVYIILFVYFQGYLVLDNQFVCSSLRKSISLTQHSIVVCTSLPKVEASWALHQSQTFTLITLGKTNDWHHA